MISLIFALFAAEPQAVQAQLQSCDLENGRYVCRYAVPDIVIVPVLGADAVAEAPAPVESPVAEVWALSPEAAHRPLTTAPAPLVRSHAPTLAPGGTIPDPGLIQPVDAGILTEREAELVARCADAGWRSLCLGHERRAARSLRDAQTGYSATRREVTRLIGETRCDAALQTALDGGYLALARETQAYCATSTMTPVASAVFYSAPAEAYVITAEPEH